MISTSNPHSDKVLDGLGHGPLAATAADEALRIFRAHASDVPIDRAIATMHGALRHTRGAAVAIAEVMPDAAEIRYVGVGNIAATVVTGGSPKSLASGNGTVGGDAHHARVFSYPWGERSTIVMHSDGLGTRWSPENYPGLWAHDPTLIAAVLCRDHERGTDDVTVAVARRHGAS